MDHPFKQRREKLEEFYILRKKQLVEKKIEIPDNIFMKCPSCNKNILTEEYIKNLHVCPLCLFHERMSAKDRLNVIIDNKTFTELDENLELKESDFPDYIEKLNEYKKRNNLKDAVITGYGKINKNKVAIGVMDSFFMMGSMGSVVGEKITRLIEFADKEKLPLIIFTASGGARMQEGIISLMQMAKTSAALNIFQNNGGLYISVLTNPTTGGVTASFASLGDIIIAEPKALVGFAGKRVIEATINEKLPDNFQTSEFMLEKGFIDKIVERKNLKNTLSKILSIHGGN